MQRILVMISCLVKASMKKNNDDQTQQAISDALDKADSIIDVAQSYVNYGNDMVDQIDQVLEENKGLLDESKDLLEKGKATVQEGVDMITSGDISTGQAMVDKGKQTTQAGADKAEDELSAEEDEASRTLDMLFNAFQNQDYGFDGQYGQSALQPQYESLTHKDGTYYIAWKSVRKGVTDQVISIADNKKTDTTQTTPDLSG